MPDTAGIDAGTAVTATIETFDDSGITPNCAGTMVTRSDDETFDDDIVMPSLVGHVGTVETKQFRNETFDDAILPFLE